MFFWLQTVMVIRIFHPILGGTDIHHICQDVFLVNLNIKDLYTLLIYGKIEVS